MEWALSEDAQVALTLNGGLAARRSSFADPRVTALPKTHRSVPFMQIAIFPRLAAETVAMPTPAIPEADLIVDVMSSGLSRIVAGEVTPKAGLDRIAAGMAQTLKEKAKLRYSVAGR